MNVMHNLFNTLQKFDRGNGRQGLFYSLPALEKAGIGPISKLPVSIRLVLESVLRNCDGKKVTEQNIRALTNWKPVETRTEEIPFIVARIVLQDFTGVPLLVDLAAMRSIVQRQFDVDFGFFVFILHLFHFVVALGGKGLNEHHDFCRCSHLCHVTSMQLGNGG